MNTPAASDRLKPSLLDRLIGTAVVSRRELRESVARDLIWLLNATRLERPAHDAPWSEVDASLHTPWTDAPLARASVLNFGLPAMTGRAQSSLDRRRLQRELEDAIRRFEPRLLPEFLEVSIDDGRNDAGIGDPASRGAHRPLRLVIQGQLRHDPVPLALWMAADLDLATGQAQLRDLRG